MFYQGKQVTRLLFTLTHFIFVILIRFNLPLLSDSGTALIDTIIIYISTAFT